MLSDGTIRQIRQLHRPPSVMHVLRMYSNTGKVYLYFAVYIQYVLRLSTLSAA